MQQNKLDTKNENPKLITINENKNKTRLVETRWIG
jgi:hypothetical protein